MNEFKYETSAKLRPLVQLFVALEFNASKYYKYSCGLNFRAPRFDLKLLVLQRSQYGITYFKILKYRANKILSTLTRKKFYSKKISQAL